MHAKAHVRPWIVGGGNPRRRCVDAENVHMLLVAKGRRGQSIGIADNLGWGGCSQLCLNPRFMQHPNWVG